MNKMTSPTYWCVFTFGTEFMDDFHLRGLFSKRDDAEAFAAALDPEPKPMIVQQPHAEVTVNLAKAYVRRAREALKS